MARYKVIGPPGTGKTRRLLNEVHRYVQKGTPLDKIGYFAFTRKAAGEARNRFLAKNGHLTSAIKILKYPVCKFFPTFFNHFWFPQYYRRIYQCHLFSTCDHLLRSIH